MYPSQFTRIYVGHQCGRCFGGHPCATVSNQYYKFHRPTEYYSAILAFQKNRYYCLFNSRWLYQSAFFCDTFVLLRSYRMYLGVDIHWTGIPHNRNTPIVCTQSGSCLFWPSNGHSNHRQCPPSNFQHKYLVGLRSCTWCAAWNLPFKPFGNTTALRIFRSPQRYCFFKFS